MKICCTPPVFTIRGEYWTAENLSREAALLLVSERKVQLAEEFPTWWLTYTEGEPE